MSKTPIKDLPRKRDDRMTQDELRNDELDQVGGGLVSTGKLGAIGGVASTPTTTVIDE
jgi:hypothetical protein